MKVGATGFLRIQRPIYAFFLVFGASGLTTVFYQTLDRDASWPLRLYFVAELYKNYRGL